MTADREMQKYLNQSQGRLSVSRSKVKGHWNAYLHVEITINDLSERDAVPPLTLKYISTSSFFVLLNSCKRGYNWCAVLLVLRTLDLCVSG